jgi:HlyD family secretion protein
MKYRKQRRLIVLFLLFLPCAGCGREKPAGFAGSGTLEATEVTVSAQTGGQVLALGREEGDLVAVGDTLARIDVEKLILQRKQLLASLDEIAANRKPVHEGITQAKDNLDNLKKTYERIAGLLEKGTATQQQYDDASTKYRLAESQFESAKSQEKLLDAKEQTVRASVALLDRQIRDGVVTSPLAGVVAEKYVERGEVAPVGGALYKIADMRRFWLKIYVAERDLGFFRVGGAATVRVDAYREPLAGVVSWVSPEAEFTPKNVETKDARAELVYAVKVTITEAPPVLKIGMPAEVYLPAR